MSHTNPSYVRPVPAPVRPPEQIQVLLPRLGRNERSFATDIGEIIGPLNVAFLHHDRVVEIFDEPVPKDEKDRFDRNKLARGGLKFRSFTGARTKGWIEQFLTTGHLVKSLDEDGKVVKDSKGKIVWEFKEKTMSEENARSLIENPFFQKKLPKIHRILTVPIPILTHQEDIRFPRPGFNSELGIYCALNAPAIQLLHIEQAIAIFEAAHKGFEFKNQAVPTLLPDSSLLISAVILGLWNRFRAGFTMPTVRVRGRIISLESLKSPTKGLLLKMPPSTITLTKPVSGSLPDSWPAGGFFTSPTVKGICRTNTSSRLLPIRFGVPGSWDPINAQSDLLIPNEAEYSLSANTGLTYREDVEPRMRKIDLAYYDEDANARVFPVEDLHGWATQNRSLLLSAVHSVYQYWTKNGCPEAHPFTSYKRWGKFVGGALKLAGLGDPTLPQDEEPLIAGDPRTAALKAVFELCYDHYPERWKDKKDISDLVAANQDQDERLEWLGDFADDRARKRAVRRLGEALALFHGRWLSGIRLLIDVSQAKITRR